MSKYRNITLEEIKNLSPQTDKIEMYIYENKWVLQNFYREKLINKRLKNCMRIAAREQKNCEDEGKGTGDFKPLSVPENPEVKWYKTQYFGWTVSLSIGVGIGYLIFN